MLDLNEDINNRLRAFKEIQKKFSSLIDENDKLIANLIKDHSKDLKVKAEKWNVTEQSLTDKLEKLNDEIYRYGVLLKKEYKVTELSGIMNTRFNEIKGAVEDYVTFKLNTEKKKQIKLVEDAKSLFNSTHLGLGQKKQLLQDEFEEKIDLFFTQWENFKITKLDAFKNVCSPHLLTQFSEPSFASFSDYISLGEKSQNVTTKNGNKEIVYPVLTKFNDFQNLVILYNESTKEKAEAISDVLIFRMLYAHLPDKLKLYLYDKRMNEKFREFLSIPTSVIETGYEWEGFIENIGKAEASIRTKLGLIFSDISSNHNSLHEYNLNLIKAEKYDEILPYFLFVVDDILSFPFEQNIQDTLSRLDNLIQYGCNVVFMVKEDVNLDKLEMFLKYAKTFRFDFINLTNTHENLGVDLRKADIKNIKIEDKKVLIYNFIDALENLASSRAKIKFKSYAIPEKAKWFSGDASKEVKIPIGKSMLKDGFEYMSFKTKDMLSNALLCGGVGSGKTNFLKGIITSLSLNYSTDELELWLVDMKNGAGFSVFNNCNLPHATKYAFSAESELINDLFFQLRKQMDERYIYFSQFSIDNLEDASKLENIDPSKLRRIVVIIDEFATIFTDDAPFLDEIANNLLSIIQKGRAMGINLLLAAQNFSNIKSSSFNQAITLIPTRILLKSSPEAAQSILGYNNKGSLEITKIGHGLINNNFGELNNDGGNFFFRSFLLDNEDLEPIIKEIKKEVNVKGFKVNEVKFIDAAQPAKFEENKILIDQLNQKAYDETFIKSGMECFLGESFLITDNHHFSFKWKINGRQSTQNILIAGNEREHTSQVVFSILSSLSYGVPKARFCVKLLNALDEDETKDLSLDLISKSSKSYDIQEFKVDDLELLLVGLESLLAFRRTSDEREPVIVFLIGMEKILKLQSVGFTESDCASKLRGIMSSGSNFGIYFVCEINKPSGISKISRDLIGFIDHKLCFFMNESESLECINSKLANQLINADAPNIRNKAIYYSQSEGTAQKFKSYSNVANTKQFLRVLKAKTDFSEINKFFHYDALNKKVVDQNESFEIDPEIGEISLDEFNKMLNK